ncbi:glycosyltransferase [Planococcus sp. APC 3900]|uniref:glycosyltransferase n=1 Tax=Planococcus sp. APC 3900 TaxID=3035191 RepID=UPI0025B4C641|nr:glycosyltransferase [Planococcus sp. APC 3900]MDN3438410.1 glycosyltransferase [Planococcus sp. APC 3900]
MKYKKIFVISPPFYSHFNPLLVLAKSFQEQGAEVTFGCSIEFKEKILKENLAFYEIDINSNKNIGKGEHAIQPDTERIRLEEFFESTKKGAVETLITQSRHRKADMLYNPQQLIDKIKFIDEAMDVDLYVVDILSYSVTLSLYFLGLPFVTFCPPHPNTIPKEGRYFNVPKSWPEAITVEEEDLKMLKQVSTQTQREFTEVFNSIIVENKSIKKISNAFSLVSEIAVIYNYFDFNDIEKNEENPKELFIGNSFEAVSLDEEWMEKIDTKEQKIMISLGTFLSNRKDVLEKLILSARESNPDALLIVSAGSNADELKKYSSPNTIIEGFIPQIALMQYVDTVVFHGGCNTLTEAMYHGKKMVILPFSSDQFNIAYDVEKNNLGRVLDPNNFSTEELAKAFNDLEEASKDNLLHWRNISRERGADYAVKKILEIEADDNV